MGSDADALLAAIWASPHDDLPRLVYADFIEERGGDGASERAEFIRLQVAREAAEAVGDDVSDAAHLREEGLAARLWPGKTRDSCSRGFPAPLVHYTAWEPSRRQLRSPSLGEAPPCRVPESLPDPPPARVALEWVSMDDSDADALGRLLDSPVARYAGRLELHPRRGLCAGDSQALAGAGHLQAAELALYGVADSTECLRGLDWPRLHRLTPPAVQDDQPILESLVAGPLASRLTELDLRSSDLTRRDLLFLADENSPFAQLRTLRLGFVAVEAGWLASLLQAPLLRQLRELDLASLAHLGAAVHPLYRALGRATLPQLRVLHAPPYSLDVELARYLVGSPDLAGLRELHLNPAGDDFPPNLQSNAIYKAALGDRLRPVAAWRHID